MIISSRVHTQYNNVCIIIITIFIINTLTVRTLHSITFHLLISSSATTSVQKSSITLGIEPPIGVGSSGILWLNRRLDRVPTPPVCWFEVESVKWYVDVHVRWLIVGLVA